MRFKRKWVETNKPCPCGLSSDAYAVDADGNGFCFRGDCNKYFPNKDTEESELNYDEMEVTKEQQELADSDYLFYPHRGISERTMKFYNVQTRVVNEEAIECGFFLPNGAVQIKNIQKGFSGNRYRTSGPYGEAGLFGKDKFDPASKDSITITEGFHDALATYEMTRGQTACVAVKSSSTAKKDCIKDWEYINSFNKIILAFDGDEPGQQAARNVSSLFDFSKVHMVRFLKYKDSNDYLENQEVDAFYKAWKNARKFVPDNIISSFAEIEKTLEEDKESRIGQYPFKALNDSLYGLHEGEVVVIKALEGVGKTAFFRLLEHHMLSTTNHNIGIIHLEEDNATTVKAIAGHELDLPAVLPDCGLSKEDILAGYKKAVKDDENRVHIYSSFDTEEEELMLNNIRFLVSAAGCKVVFLDHISWLATGMQDEDERKKLDRLSQRLKLLAKELRFCLVMISHVNDDGKTRGSRNISKVANTVISLHRDLLSKDPIVRNTTEIVIEKARLGGRTGPAGKGIFNPETGKLEDPDKELIS